MKKPALIHIIILLVLMLASCAPEGGAQSPSPSPTVAAYNGGVEEPEAPDDSLLSALALGYEYGEAVKWLDERGVSYEKEDGPAPEEYGNLKRITASQDGTDYSLYFYLSPVDLPQKRLYRLGLLAYGQTVSDERIKELVAGFGEPSWRDDAGLPCYEKYDNGVYTTICVEPGRIYTHISNYSIDSGPPVYAYEALYSDKFKNQLPVTLTVYANGKSIDLQPGMPGEQPAQTISELGSEYAQAVDEAEDVYENQGIKYKTEDGKFECEEYFGNDYINGSVDIRLNGLKFELNSQAFPDYSSLISTLGYPTRLLYSELNGYSVYYYDYAEDPEDYSCQLTLELDNDLKVKNHLTLSIQY